MAISTGAGQSAFDPVAEQHYLRAVELAKAGKPAEAESEFRAAWTRKPSENRYVQGLTSLYTHSHQFDRALEVLHDHVRRNGPTPLGWTLQGELLFEQKQYEPAYQSLHKALEHSNENYRAHQLIGLIYVVFRREMDALEELGTAARQNPNSAQVQFFYGRICYQTANYSQARDAFLTCLRLQPGYPKALENLALAYEALQQDSLAIDSYEQAIALDKAGKTPPSEDPYVDYGLLLARRGETDRGLAMLRNALRRNPDSARANFEIGKLLFQKARYREAEEFLLRSATLDPHFSRPHYFLGRIYQRKQRTEEASAHFSLFERLNRVPENRQARITGRLPGGRACCREPSE